MGGGGYAACGRVFRDASFKSKVTRAPKDTSRAVRAVPGCARRIGRWPECAAQYMERQEQHGSDGGWNVDRRRRREDWSRHGNVDARRRQGQASDARRMVRGKVADRMVRSVAGGRFRQQERVRRHVERGRGSQAGRALCGSVQGGCADGRERQMASRRAVRGVVDPCVRVRRGAGRGIARRRLATLLHDPQIAGHAHFGENDRPSIV